jgi:hypothetical protein
MREAATSTDIGGRSIKTVTRKKHEDKKLLDRFGRLA